MVLIIKQLTKRKHAESDESNSFKKIKFKASNS